MHLSILAILCFVLILETSMLAISIMKFYIPALRWDSMAAKTIPVAQLLLCVGTSVALWISQDVNNGQNLVAPSLLYIILSLVAAEVSVCLLRPLIRN
jgi:hypothetical protein